MATIAERPVLGQRVSTRRVLSQFFIYLLLAMVGIVVVMPFLWLIGNSFRTFENVLHDITRIWPENFYLNNWAESLSKFNFVLYLRNSLIITVVPMVTSIAAAALTAFGFTRFKSRWLDLSFGLMLATMMVPGQIITIPLYVLYTRLHWVDTFYPFIVPALFAGAFDVFLLRQFFLTVPRDLADAATMDGANNILIFRHVYIPLSTAPIAALVVLQFLGRWNDYYGPSVYLQSQKYYVLQQGLTYLMGVYGASLGTGHDTMNMVPWNLLSAASILVTIPIIVLFFLAQKQFIEGIRFTGLKG
jgi:multiple sugar transport system permease protein